MKRTLFGLLLTLGLLVQTTTAQYLPTDARVLNSARVPLLRDEPAVVPLVEQVGAIGMTVSDMDASVDFYSRVLSFEKVSDVEVTGEDYERLQGVFGLRMRVVRMRLGDEFIELTEYLAPRGRPVPVDHAATIAGFSISRSLRATWTKLTRCCGKTKSNMLLLVHNVCRIGIRTRPASRLSTFAIQTNTGWRSCNFLKARAIRSGSRKTSCFWESIIRLLSSAIQKRA